VKRLCRSKKDALVCGICSGLAKYLNIDPSIIRLGYVVFFILNPIAAIILYFSACIILPENGEECMRISTIPPRKYTLLLLGVLLIVIGLMLTPIWNWSLIFKLWSFIWSFIKVGVGILLIIIGIILVLVALGIRSLK